jgi:hypothetical protein
MASPIVRVRLPERVHARVLQAAAAEGLTISGWLRRAALDRLGDAAREALERAELLKEARAFLAVAPGDTAVDRDAYSLVSRYVQAIEAQAGRLSAASSAAAPVRWSRLPTAPWSRSTAQRSPSASSDRTARLWCWRRPPRAAVGSCASTWPASGPALSSRHRRLCLRCRAPRACWARSARRSCSVRRLDGRACAGCSAPSMAWCPARRARMARSATWAVGSGRPDVGAQLLGSRRGWRPRHDCRRRGARQVARSANHPRGHCGELIEQRPDLLPELLRRRPEVTQG